MKAKLNKTNLALTGALAVSGIIGLWIISTDAWLWSVAPEHAFGLIAFVGFDAIFAAAVWKFVRPATAGIVVFAVVQVLMMAGDIAFYRPPGVVAEAWISYLTGNAYFMSLLILKVAILGLALVAVARMKPSILTSRVKLPQ